MKLRSLGCLLVALLLHLVVPPAGAGEPAVTGAPPSLNERFVDPQLEVEKWIERFEGESREVFASREEILKATGAKAGARVADIGAGTGLFTRSFSERVGSGGWVYAVEIAPRFLDHINAWVQESNATNVTAVLGRTDDVSLAPGSIDLAFVCDTYHHFEAVKPTLASIRRALAPGGHLVVVDFERIPGQSRDWLLEHVRAGKEVFRAEIEAAGFAFVEEVEISGFEENYFLRFRRK